MKEKSKIILTILFMCLTNVILGQTKIDTIMYYGYNAKIIIEYPSINKVDTFSYEEGFFKNIICILDTVGIIIHCGGMVNLPLTNNLEGKVINSEFLLKKDVRILRGSHTFLDRKKYFREDNYFKYGITFVYQNVDETKLNFYEQIFNNIKIIDK